MWNKQSKRELLQCQIKSKGSWCTAVRVKEEEAAGKFWQQKLVFAKQMKPKESHRLPVLCGSRWSWISQPSPPLLGGSPRHSVCGTLAFWQWLQHSNYCELLKFCREQMLKGEGWIPFFPSICCHPVANAAMAARASQATLGMGTAWALVTSCSLARVTREPSRSCKEGGSCLTLIWTGKDLGKSQTEINCCRKIPNHTEGWSWDNRLVQTYSPHIPWMSSPLRSLSFLSHTPLARWKREFPCCRARTPVAKRHPHSSFAKSPAVQLGTGTHARDISQLFMFSYLQSCK